MITSGSITLSDNTPVLVYATQPGISANVIVSVQNVSVQGYGDTAVFGDNTISGSGASETQLGFVVTGIYTFSDIRGELYAVPSSVLPEGATQAVQYTVFDHR